MKFLYKPFGTLVSVLGGILAGLVFKQIWSRLAGEQDSPNATDRDRGWGEILVSAAIQGAVYGGVKAAVDRAGAKGFERATGVWPGETHAKAEER